MIKCYRCDCKTLAVYECLKEDFMVYSCMKHVTNEESSIAIEYSSSQYDQLESLKALISTKKDLLSRISKILLNIKAKYKPSVYVKSKNPSNQFLIAGLVTLRQAAGQKQNRNLAHMLKLGIKALQVYPLPILHPEQAMDLQGLGPSLTKSLHSLFHNNYVKYKSLKKAEKPVVHSIDHNDVNIKLYVDLRETRANNLTSLVENQKIEYTVKTLSLGDYLFVAETINKDYVIDLIIERKSSSDLNSSHFTNHLRDQIRRLKSSSFSRTVLLIEGKANYKIVAEMWLRHKITIMLITSQKRMLMIMKMFQEYFSEKYRTTDSVCELEEFSKFQEKNSNCDTVGDIFYRQLLEFPGMGAKKINLFINLYPTLIDFLRCYKESSTLVHQNLMWCGIGPALETSLYEFFGIKR